MVIFCRLLAMTRPRHTPVQMCFKAGRVRLTPDRVVFPRRSPGSASRQRGVSAIKVTPPRAFYFASLRLNSSSFLLVAEKKAPIFTRAASEPGRDLPSEACNDLLYALLPGDRRPSLRALHGAMEPPPGRSISRFR